MNPRHLIIWPLLCLPATIQANPWEKLLQESWHGDSFSPLAAGSVATTEQFFTSLLQGNDPSQRQKEGWQLHTVGKGILLREKSNQQQGRGAYSVDGSKTSSTPRMIQAPHSKDDLHTGVIAAHLFAEGCFNSGAWNSVSRKIKLADGSLADLAHRSDSHFMAFSRAFAHLHGNGEIIQLHGFEAGKRKSARAEASDAILSTTTATLSPRISQLATCLSKSSGRTISLYPKDVQELGGTTNAIANQLRGDGFNGFIHMETSKEYRQALLTDAEERHHLLRCLCPEEHP